ncbi:MAG: hypothetical protein ACLR5H_05155 [Oscillospiraceae bacterium]
MRLEELTMAFTAADVKNLREMTSVGMMDCKKALTESDGDMDKAVEWLREKGLAKARQEGRPHRRRGHGLCHWCEDGVGAMVEVNCETDFCAKYATSLSHFVRISPGRSDKSSRRSGRPDGLQVSRHRADRRPRSCRRRSWSIGENLQIRRFARFAREHHRGLCPRRRQDRRAGEPRGRGRRRRLRRSARTSPCRSRL